MLAWGIAPGIRLPGEPSAESASQFRVVSQSQIEVNRAFSADVVLGFAVANRRAPGSWNPKDVSAESAIHFCLGLRNHLLN